MTAPRTPRKPIERAPSYYLMSHNYNTGNRPGLSLINFDTIVVGTGRTVMGPPRGGTGFPKYSETPRFLIDPKLGRRVRDLEECHEYWFISARLKTVFETVDPAGFAFAACDTVLPDGSPGPEHWLCDIVTVLDAVDEETSTIRIIEPPTEDRRRYQFLSNTSLVFRPDIVADHHVFRLTYRRANVICDDILRNACKAAGMDGIYYRDAALINR